MNTIRYSLKHVFARDIALKMNYGSSFDLVKLEKVTVEYTSKYLLEDPKHSFLAFVALKLVTNQTPKMTFAQKSVAAFKLKKGQVLGCTATLRGNNMDNFLQQCIFMHIPRIKQLKLLSNDQIKPNVHFGISQMLFFPSLEKHVNIFEALEGCTIQIHTTASNNNETLLLCSMLKLPTVSVNSGKA